MLTFIPSSHGGSTWNVASIGLRVSKEKKFENVESEWLWTKVNDLFIFIKLQLTASANYDIIDYNCFWIIHSHTKGVGEGGGGHGSHPGYVTMTSWTDFLYPDLWRLRMKFGFNCPRGFRGEDVWKCWRRRTTYPISSPMTLRLRWANNGLFFFFFFSNWIAIYNS